MLLHRIGIGEATRAMDIDQYLDGFQHLLRGIAALGTRSGTLGVPSIAVADLASVQGVGDFEGMQPGAAQLEFRLGDLDLYADRATLPGKERVGQRLCPGLLNRQVRGRSADTEQGPTSTRGAAVANGGWASGSLGATERPSRVLNGMVR